MSEVPLTQSVVIHPRADTNADANANANSNADTVIYLCSKSKLKNDVVNQLFENLQMFQIHEKKKYWIVNLQIPEGLSPEQPINEWTSDACSTRIWYGKETQRLNDGDKIIALENGIYMYDDQKQYYDVCCMMVYDHTTKKTDRYNSFGIQIDPDLLGLYLNPVTNSQMRPDGSVYTRDQVITGYGSTFGQYLNRKFGVDPGNWMKDPRFGNVDRLEQMKDCCDKYLIDSLTLRIPDFPKQGVVFKHMVQILTNPFFFNILNKLLKRMISDNFDINSVDFFAGLCSRGYWFAPILAMIFGKGFIPITKASKVPNSASTKRKKYNTEYSADEFALEESVNFLPVGGVKRTCLIVDDLLATGDSIAVGALNVLTENGVNVLGAVTVHDVPELRAIASEKLKKHNLKCIVLVNENGLPNDFAPLKYKIPECLIKRIESDDSLDQYERKYTLTDEQWVNENKTETETEKIEAEAETEPGAEPFQQHVRFIYTEKERSLAEKIFESLKLSLPLEKLRAGITTGKFSNGETRVQIESSVRNMHVIIISQIRTGFVNDDVMELLLTLDACVRSGTSKITVILPYYPYSRSDKKDHPRCPIAAALIAKLLSSSHIDNLVSLDLHAGQIQGFIERGFHNLYMKNNICDHMFNDYLKFYNQSEWNRRFILIAPDAGSARAVKGYSKILGINNVILDKQRDYSKPGTVIGSRIIGSPDDLKDKIGFIIDDMADTFGTLCSAAKTLVEYGIKYVIVFVTHGVLSGPAIENINTTPHIKEVVVTDTLPQEQNLINCPKLRVISCAELIARSVDGILTGRSVSRLF
jgi:ribose-phosphate pyrophosphokinase